MTAQGPQDCGCDNPRDIDRLYAWIARDPADGTEGLTAARMGDTMMPLVGADLARVNSLERFARQAAEISGQAVSLVQFERAGTLKTITPGGR